MKTNNSLLRFSAVGDISFGDHPLCIGFGAYSKFRQKSPLYPFEHVINPLLNSDLTFGNLECAVSEIDNKHTNLKNCQMLGHPKQIKGLTEAGFNILNFANNHCMQHGEKPFLKTLRLLKESNIQYCGVNTENHLRGKPTFFQINNTKIAFLGYSLRPRQYFANDPLYSEGYIEGIPKDITNLKNHCHVIIVSLHWGDEFIQEPSPNEIAIGRSLIDAGANIVLGHHPHVLRGIESYKDGVIIYSLGNFVCDMIWDPRLRESIIFSCTFDRSGIHEIQMTPIYINDNYQPEIMNNSDGLELLSRISQMSEELNNENLNPLNSNDFHYREKAETTLSFYRRKSHLYFLLNIFKYPFFILFQQFISYLKNRLKEIRD